MKFALTAALLNAWSAGYDASQEALYINDMRFAWWGIPSFLG